MNSNAPTRRIMFYSQATVGRLSNAQIRDLGKKAKAVKTTKDGEKRKKK